MPNETWYEVGSSDTRYGNVEAVIPAARAKARDTDDAVEIYQVTRTLVRTIQRTISVSETPVP